MIYCNKLVESILLVLVSIKCLGQNISCILQYKQKIDQLHFLTITFFSNYINYNLNDFYQKLFFYGVLLFF